jgi:tetratricopeptide (TPR) repeat protein
MKKVQPLVVLAAILAISANSAVVAAPDAETLRIQQRSPVWMKWQREATELTDQGKYEEAEKVWKTLIADRAPMAMDLNAERSGLAQTYVKWGKPELAEPLFKINIQHREAEDGPKGNTLFYPLNEYATFLASQGRTDEAKQYKDRADAIEKSGEEEGARIEAAEKRAAQHPHHSHKKH